VPLSRAYSHGPIMSACITRIGIHSLYAALNQHAFAALAAVYASIVEKPLNTLGALQWRAGFAANGAEPGPASNQLSFHMLTTGPPSGVNR
jgi:hypothetical protein